MDYQQLFCFFRFCRFMSLYFFTKLFVSSYVSFMWLFLYKTLPCGYSLIRFNYLILFLYKTLRLSLCLFHVVISFKTLPCGLELIRFMSFYFFTKLFVSSYVSSMWLFLYKTLPCGYSLIT